MRARLPRMAAIVLLLAAPAALVQHLWLPGTLGVFVLGALPATLAVVSLGPGRAWRVASAAALAGGLAALLSAEPALGAVLVGALAFCAGYCARWGTQSGLLFLPILAAFVTISPPALVDARANPITGLHYAGLVTTALLLGGCWAALLGSVFTRGLVRRTLSPVSSRAALAYALALAASTALVTAVAGTFFPGSTAPWVVLTIVLVMKPHATEMWRTAAHRVGGTILGVLAAGFMVWTLGQWDAPGAVAEPVLGGLCLVLALSLLQVRPYWQFVTWITPAIILLRASGQHERELEAQRLLMTLTGTALAVLFALAVREINARLLTAMGENGRR